MAVGAAKPGVAFGADIALVAIGTAKPGVAFGADIALVAVGTAKPGAKCFWKKPLEHIPVTLEGGHPCPPTLFPVGSIGGCNT